MRTSATFTLLAIKCSTGSTLLPSVVGKQKQQLSSSPYPDICYVRNQAETTAFQTKVLSLGSAVVVTMVTASLSWLITSCIDAEKTSGRTGVSQSDCIPFEIKCNFKNLFFPLANNAHVLTCSWVDHSHAESHEWKLGFLFLLALSESQCWACSWISARVS